MQFDRIVIGAGLVGLAAAQALLHRNPDARVLVLDKEAGPATHQSGRNSGVLHSGIYYNPGSLRARLCVQGKARLESFCAQHDVALVHKGKVIVATRDDERPRLEAILQRGKANGVPCTRIGREQLLEIEPHCAGIDAIHVPSAGSVDFPGVAARLSELLIAGGATAQWGAQVLSISESANEVSVRTTAGDFQADMLIACAGLYSDKIARMGGVRPSTQILPFRGEYHALNGDATALVNGHIYPVPDPRFPFLGVHLSPGTDGIVKCGPNAVLALGREGYRWSDIHLGELAAILRYPGFWSLARRYSDVAIDEVLRSFSKVRFLKGLQRLLPAIHLEHLVPYPAGVRAMAVAKNGDLLDDFVIERSKRQVHVLNAPSPAATACLAIGDYLVANYL